MDIKEHAIEEVYLCKLKRLPFNRDTNRKQVLKIKSSISLYGLLRLPVCVKTTVINGKNELFILDGQHLTESYDKLDKKKIKAIVVKTDDLNTIVKMMATLNNINLKWTCEDYVNAYSSMGLVDYNILKRHSIDNKFHPLISGAILTGAGKRSYKDIKEGTFKVKIDDPDTYTKYVNDFTSFFGGKSIKSLTYAYIEFIRDRGLKDYNHKLMIQNLKKSSILTEKLPSDVGYLNAYLHTIYEEGDKW